MRQRLAVLALLCAGIALGAEPVAAVQDRPWPGPLARPWSAEQGAIRLRVTIPAGHGVRERGLRLVDGRPEGAPEGGPSRLTLHLHRIATWTGSTPALVFLLDDRSGQAAARLSAFAGVAVADGEEHDFAAAWDLAAGSIALAMDGIPLPLRERRIPPRTQGRDPVTRLTVAPGSHLHDLLVLPHAIPLILEE